jgi:hypothetical protein
VSQTSRRNVPTPTVHGKPPSAAHMHWGLKPSAASGLPLPKGAGRGEGEGIARQPTAHEVARCNSLLSKQRTYRQSLRPNSLMILPSMILPFLCVLLRLNRFGSWSEGPIHPFRRSLRCHADTIRTLNLLRISIFGFRVSPHCFEFRTSNFEFSSPLPLDFLPPRDDLII